MPPLTIDAPSTYNILFTPYGETHNPPLTGIVSLQSSGSRDLPSVSVSLMRSVTISTKSSALRQIVKKKQPLQICYKEVLASTKAIDSRQEAPTEEDQTLSYDFALALPTALCPTTHAAIATTTYVLAVHAKTEDDEILETHQDIRVNRVMVANAPLVFEHFRKFGRLPFTTKLFLSPQALPDYTSENTFNATVELEGPLLQCGRASEIKVVTIREIRWSVAEAIEVSSGQYPSASSVHPEKRFMRTICEGKTKGNWMPDDSDSWDDKEGSSVRVQVPFHIHVRNCNASDNMELVLPESPSANSPATFVAKEAAPEMRIAISLSHRLRLEIVLGEDTVIQGAGTLVDRKPARHCLGATYPLHIGRFVNDASIPEGAVEGDIELPGYEVSGEMPPSYQV